MQIHELPAGTPAAGMTFAGDTGTQTQKIDYDALADAILNKLTTKTFDIKSEAQTIIAVLNALGDAAEQGVANNLVTTDAGYVLDARQGKALSDLHATNANAIAALNSSAVTSYNTYYCTDYPEISATAMRSGNIVTVYVTSTTNYAITRNTYFRITTLPEKYRPRWTIPFPLFDNTATSASNAMIAGRIGSDGSVDFWIYAGAPTNNAPRGTVSYCV